MADTTKTSGEIRKEINNLDSKDITRKIAEVTSNTEIMEKLTEAISNDPQLMRMAPELANDPRLASVVNEAKQNITRKEAIKMKKQMNQAAHNSRVSKGSVQGVVIIPSRKVKAIEVLKTGKDSEEPDMKELAKHLGVHPKDTMGFIVEGNYRVFYNANSRGKNKRIMKLFPGKELGNIVIILNEKYSPLSVENVLEYEKSVI